MGIDIDLSAIFSTPTPFVPAPFVEDVFLLPLYTFSCFVKNQVFVGVWVNAMEGYSLNLEAGGRD